MSARDFNNADPWRVWALGILGNTPTNRAASDEDLRRALGQRMQALSDDAERLAQALADRFNERTEARYERDAAERDRDAFAEKLVAIERLAPQPELVDGQPIAFVPTQEEADALGLDLAASYTATLTRRAYSVTAILEIADATGARVGIVERSYRSTAAEVSLKRPAFSGKQLRRRRARLERRLAHLTERSASRPEGTAAYDVAEASALQTALVLFDEALVAGGDQPDEGALARADRTEHLEHLIDVICELAAAGDTDAIRMHYEHHKGVARG